jgi:hypothetical protein
MPEWYVSSLMMDRALDAVVRWVKHLDRKHDIPYLAGYSLDGNTIYIDRHMPQSFKFRGRVIETDRFLLLHEEVEKTPIDRLGLHYLHAHQIATRAEQAAVRAAGISWRAYDRFMQKNVKRDGDERLSKVPADLDTKPYRDEHDFDLLRRMMAAVDKGHLPSTRGKAAVRNAIEKVMHHVEGSSRRKGVPSRQAKGQTGRREVEPIRIVPGLGRWTATVTSNIRPRAHGASSPICRSSGLAATPRVAAKLAVYRHCRRAR